MAESSDGRYRWGEIVGLALLLAVALSLRLYGIGAESFWIDEAFTARFSDHSIGEVLRDNAKDVHPPLYYLGVFCWRRAFGDTDAIIRSYSLLWSMVGLLIAYFFVRDLGGRRAALIALMLGVLNPLQIHFAQEARMYSQVATFCTFGSWCLWRWMVAATESAAKATCWRWAIGYTICSAVALYTHYLSVLVLIAQGAFAILVFSASKQWKHVGWYMAGACIVVTLFLPWFLFVRQFRGSLYHEGLGWIQTPALSDYYSFLGKEFFWGPFHRFQDQRWVPTLVFSFFVLGMCIRRVWPKPACGAQSPGSDRPVAVIYPLWLLIGPVILAAIVGWVYHPVYFRPRFGMFVFAPYLALTGIAFDTFRKPVVTWSCTVVLAALMLWGTTSHQRTTLKEDWRSLAKLWEVEGSPQPIVFFPTLLEVAVNRYTKQPISSATREQIEGQLPQLRGSKIYLCCHSWEKVAALSDYYHWLTSLGTVHDIGAPDYITVRTVHVGVPVPQQYRDRFVQWYEPFDMPRKILGFGSGTPFSFLEHREDEKAAFRWSAPLAWFFLVDWDNISTVVLNAEFPPPVPATYAPNLMFHLAGTLDTKRLFDTEPVVRINKYRVGPFEIHLPVPKASGRLWIGWKMNGVNLLRAGVSNDGRDLGLKIYWVGLVQKPE